MNIQTQNTHQTPYFGSNGSNGFFGRQTYPQTNENSSGRLTNPFSRKSVLCGQSQTWSQPQFQSQSIQSWNSSNSTSSEPFLSSFTPRTFSNNIWKENSSSKSSFKTENSNPFSKTNFKTFEQSSPEKSFSKEGNLFTRPQKNIVKQTENKQSLKNLFSRNSQNVFHNPNTPTLFNNNSTNIFQKSEVSIPSIFNNKNCSANPFNNPKKEKNPQEQFNLIQERLKELEKKEENIKNIQERLLYQVKQNQSLRQMVVQIKQQMTKKEQQMTERINKLEQTINKQSEKQTKIYQTDNQTTNQLQESMSSQNSVNSQCESIDSNKIKKSKKKSNKKPKRQNEEYKHSIYEFAPSMEKKSPKIKIYDAVQNNREFEQVESIERKLNEKMEENSKKMFLYLEEKFEESEDKMDKILEILKMNSTQNSNKIIKNPFC